MSADNAVAILITRDTFLQESEGHYTRIAPAGAGIPVYRVAHIQGPDTFEIFRTEEFHNLGWWMADAFSEALVFTDETAAEEAAYAMEEAISYAEYGIMTLDAQDLNFPGC